MLAGALVNILAEHVTSKAVVVAQHLVPIQHTKGTLSVPDEPGMLAWLHSTATRPCSAIIGWTGEC